MVSSILISLLRFCKIPIAWDFIVSRYFWYASGATNQVLYLGVKDIEIEEREGYHAHNIGEVVNTYWGTATCNVFIAFYLLTNIIVTTMLLSSRVVAVNALTTVKIYAASFLIFGMINTDSNCSTMLVDDGSWVSSIAARPSSSTHKSYFWGGWVGWVIHALSEREGLLIC